MKKDRICHSCGEICYGRECEDCVKKEKYRGVYRVKAKLGKYDKVKK